MKKIFSFILAIGFVASVCAGLLMLLGPFSFTDALLCGIGAAIAGALAPVVVAWLDGLFRKPKRQRP